MTSFADWVVVVLDEDGKAERRPFRRNMAVIGRGADNDVVLPSVQVSRKHAVIEIAGDQVFVIDLGSANGVLVNGRKVNKQAIGPADELTIGEFRLRLERSDGRPIAAAPVAVPPEEEVPPVQAPPVQAPPSAKRGPQALLCPQCGAPLHVFPESGPLVTCIYCNTVVRL
jgi:pSer/pThr/pTyr-binding forkhead associated (FHA) protein